MSLSPSAAARALGGLVLISVPIVISACGGGASGGSSPGLVPATEAPAKTAQVRFEVEWPVRGTASASAGRHRDYLSPSTASVSLTISSSGGTPTTTVVNNPNLGAGATSGTTTTTIVTVPAPIGNDTFAVDDYDAIGAAGNLLAKNSMPFTVVSGIANVFTITLNGNLAKIACAPVAPFVTGSPSAFTLVGPAGQIALEPEDADGNIIVAPGTLPALSLAAATPSQATITSTAATNEYTVNVLTVGTPVTLDASGTNLTGTAVTSTCAITRQEALYVANQGVYGTRAASVTIYPATASGNATPTATLEGAATDMQQINFVAVDPKGDLFVSNEGPMPGSTFSPTSGYVTIYGPGAAQNGNVAPIASITGLQVPEGMAFDANNNLYVLTIDRILEYPPTANGVTATASPSATIVGAMTGLNSDYGLDVGLTGTIYAAGVDDVLSDSALSVFPAGSNGNVAPIVITAPGQETTSAASTSSTQSWLGVAADASGNMYVAASNNNLNLVDEYAPQTTSGSATPSDVAPGFTQPSGIFIDKFGATPTNSAWVANYAGNSVDYFSTLTLLAGGATTDTSTLSGASTGLNVPFGVFVR